MHRSKAYFFEALGSRNEKPPHEKKEIPEAIASIARSFTSISDDKPQP